MRRNYISPEFKYTNINGTMNMMEQTSFFGSKMLDIQDLISILNENLIYYQDQSKEQLNFSLEKNLDPIVYSSVNDKLSNHTIKSDESQSSIQVGSNTKWNIEIDISKILSNYIFATLKKYRTFEGVKNNMTIFNNIDSGINDYIIKNIINRYKYKSVDFFVDYKSFSEDGSMKYKNTFVEITNNSFITKKIQSILNDSQGKLNIIFNQEKYSTSYNFNYYFNLYFEKI